MIDDLKVFLTTSTNSKNYLEIAGNVLLTPARCLWNGHTVKVAHLKTCKSLKMHADNPEINPCLFGKFLCALVLIATIIPGALLKGLAYLSSDVKNRHFEIKESLQIEKNPPKGVTIDDRKVIIDVSDLGQDSLETFIAEKLKALNPHVSHQFYELHFENVPSDKLDLDLSVTIDVNSEHPTLENLIQRHLLLPPSDKLHLKNSAFNNAFDIRMLHIMEI